MTENKSKLLKKAVDKFGTTDKCSVSGYILPDGRMLDMTFPAIPDVRTEHSAIESIYPKGTTQVPRRFVKDTGAIRMATAPNTTFLELESTHNLTPEQISTIRECACKQGLEPHRIIYDILTEGKLIDSGEAAEKFRYVSCNMIVNKFVGMFNVVKKGD